MLGGLASAMPAQYGGLGLGYRSGLMVAWGLGITLMTCLVLAGNRLLRRTGLRHPLMVVLGGLTLGTVLTTGCLLLLRAGAVQPPDWCGVLVLPVVGLCFGLVAGWMQRSTRL